MRGPFLPNNGHYNLRASCIISFPLPNPFAVDLVPANLPKLLNLLSNASPEWFALGLQLGVDQTTLRVIEQDNHHVTRRCFTDMLSEWLKMIDPLPSWVGLVAALQQPSLGHHHVAKVVKKELGWNTEPDCPQEEESKWLC
jgi:hypothetical protein